MTARNDVLTLNDRFSKAVANQSVDDVLELYEDNARLLAPNAPMAQGHEAMRQVFQGFIEMGTNSLQLEIVELHESGELVIDVGRYTLGIQPPGAEPIEDRGKYVDVMRRQADGSLKLIADIFNSDAPLA